MNLLAGLACAQGEAALTSSPTQSDGKEPVVAVTATAVDGYERRAALRATLQAQRGAANRREDMASGVGERQLNEKERAELRRQVRQQRHPPP